MTLPSSKSLEFEALIMIGLEGGVFPSNFDRIEEQVEEAARLFYVGVTRAKKLVHLRYAFKGSPFISKNQASNRELSSGNKALWIAFANRRRALLRFTGVPARDWNTHW